MHFYTLYEVKSPVFFIYYILLVLLWPDVLRLGFSVFRHNLIHPAGIITISSYLASSSFSLRLSSRSLPGSALELRYSHGSGSLPAGSTTHLDPFGNASAGGVVRRSHRARWSSAREDSTKVRIQQTQIHSHPFASCCICFILEASVTQLLFCSTTKHGKICDIV